MEASRQGSVVMAFTEDHVQRLAGVTKRQLRYWDRTGFFTPSLASGDRKLPYSRVYSFRDVVSLQILNSLLKDGNVPLRHLREVKAKLGHMGDDLWARTTLYVLNRRVVIDSSDDGGRENVVDGQRVLCIPLQVVRRDMESRVRLLWERPSEQIGKIARKRNVAGNLPVIAGTRVPVRAIKAFAAAGYETEDILTEYPALQPEDVTAALAYEDAA